MDVMILATELNAIGKLLYNVLYKWVLSWGNDYSLIGAFGIMVILFTIFLKVLTSPLDVWQKLLARKNAKKMEAMKPELDKINKQYATDKEQLMIKQRKLYKEHGYSAFSACLPTIVTLVVFMVVFTGFNSAVRFHNSVVYDELDTTYFTTYDKAYTEAKAVEGTSAEAANAAATKAAEDAVVATYKPERFLMTTNIFMPDTWKNPIPDISVYTGTGMGKLGITDIDASRYAKVMKPVIEKYNVNEKGKSKWNGYLILPLFAMAFSILSSKLVKPPEQPQTPGQTEEQAKAQQSQAKIMQYMMPVIFGVFSLFYSTAFTLYMVLSNVLTLILNLTWNIVQKRLDAKEKDRIMSVTIKK